MQPLPNNICVSKGEENVTKDESEEFKVSERFHNNSFYERNKFSKD